MDIEYVFSQGQEGGVYSPNSYRRLKKKILGTGGLEYYEIEIYHPTSGYENKYLVIIGYDYVNFAGEIVPNGYPKGMSFFEAESYYDSSSSFYVGGDLAEGILLKPRNPYSIYRRQNTGGIYGDAINMIAGQNGNDAAFLAVKREDIRGIRFNDIGISLVDLLDDASGEARLGHMLFGVRALYWIDGGQDLYINPSIMARFGSTSEVKTGPGLQVSVNNGDNIVFVHQDPYSLRILSATDFLGGQDVLVLPWSSKKANLVFVSGKWNLLVPGSSAEYVNLEYIQFSDTAYRLGSDGVKIEVPFRSYAVSVSVNISLLSATEDGLPGLVYTFVRSGYLGNELTVNYGVGGSAGFGSDYNQSGASAFSATAGSVTFAANTAAATVTIDPIADNLLEADETVVLTLAAGMGYAIGTPTAAIGKINNDDSIVTFAVLPAAVDEDGTTNLVYIFTRTGFTGNALTVNYGVSGTAAFGSDYGQSGAATFNATAGSVTFAANATTATVTIDPTADNTLEGNETVALTLAVGSGYTIGTPSSATGTINNDDSTVNLAVSLGAVDEDGTPNLVYIFTRTGFTGHALTVNFGVGGTAGFGSDYAQSGAAAFTATAGSVSFAANASTATVTIDPMADNTPEENETVALTLAVGSGYMIGTPASVSGTITNDDSTVTLAAD